MTDSLPPRSDAGHSATGPKSGSNRVGMIVLAAILVCCGCLAALLVGQYFLENSDFSLVKLLLTRAA